MDRRGPRPRCCAGPRGPCCARSPGFPVPAPARCRPPSPPAPAGARRKCDGWAVPVRAGTRAAVRIPRRARRAAAAAAGRQALAEAVPVIDDFQARSVQRQDHGDGLVLLVDGGDVGVVGVQCARRVVLAAVQAVVAVLARQPRGDRAWACLCSVEAPPKLAGQDAAELLPHVFVGRQHAPQRRHVVVQAQRVRHVGVGGGQRDDGLGHVLQRAVRPAMLGRHQQRAQARRAHGVEGVEGQALLAFARHGAGEQGPPSARQAGEDIVAAPGGAARRPVLRAGRGRSVVDVAVMLSFLRCGACGRCGVRHAAFHRVSGIGEAGRGRMARRHQAVHQRLVLGGEGVVERLGVGLPLLDGAGRRWRWSPAGC